jgi:hypothetical protein
VEIVESPSPFQIAFAPIQPPDVDAISDQETIISGNILEHTALSAQHNWVLFFKAEQLIEELQCLKAELKDSAATPRTPCRTPRSSSSTPSRTNWTDSIRKIKNSFFTSARNKRRKTTVNEDTVCCEQWQKGLRENGAGSLTDHLFVYIY